MSIYLVLFIYYDYASSDDAPKLQKKRVKITDTDNEDDDDEKKGTEDKTADKAQDKIVESSDDENTPISNEPE